MVKLAQRLATQQPHLRPAGRPRHRRRRQRRGHAVAPVVGAHRSAERSRDRPPTRRSSPRCSARGRFPWGTPSRASGRSRSRSRTAAHDPPLEKEMRMNRRVLRPLVASLLAAGSTVIVGASTARFWRVSTQADLLKGQSERLSIDYDGRLVLGPSTRSVLAPTSPFVWCLAPGPDGSVYAGGGNDGIVWHVDRDGKSRVAFDAQELEVHALATASRRGAAGGDLARRQGLPRGVGRGADRVLRSGGQVHLGARGGRAGPRVRRHRKQGRHLPRLGRRQERGVLPHADVERHVAADGPRRPDLRRHGVARARAPHHAGRQGLPAARVAVPGDPRASRRRGGDDLRRRGERQVQRPGVADAPRLPRSRPGVRRWHRSRRRSWP